jgi:CcmD family protein
MRSIRLILLAAALVSAPLAVSAAPALARAQATAPAASADTAGPPITAAPAAGSTHGLPIQAAPPRTLRAYWHVFVAFTLAWVMVFGYALWLGARFSKLEREVESLRGTA